MLKYFLACLSIAFISILIFNFLQVKAVGTVYYFNNAVNTNPATLGNYWLNAGQTVPATILPDLSVDILHVVSATTYNGNAIFRGSGTNNGTVTGTATFYEDDSENLGTVTGMKTRRYTADIVTSRDFTDGGAWTVMADGAEVDVNRAAYDGTTTFTTANGGFFIYFFLSFGSIDNDSLVLEYDQDLDDTSVPATSDYIVSVNSIVVPVSSISISGTKVTLNLASSVSPGETVLLDYTPGVNPLQNLAGYDAYPLTDHAIIFSILLPGNPLFSSVVDNQLYVSHDNKISVINTDTNTLVTTLSGGTNTYYSSSVGNQVYVSNNGSSSVSVVNTTSNTVTATIPVGTGPYFSKAVGTKVYVGNQSSANVSVINTLTNTVVATIPVGNTPYFSTVVGTKLYVNNYGSDTVSVIDTTTNTVTATISVGDGPFFSTSVGTKVYVANNNSNTVSVINTLTNTVVATIPVGSTPYLFALVGTKLYLNNYGSDTVSVIDTNTNTVTSTIPVGLGPYYISVIGNKVYVDNSSDSTISVIDSTTDTVVDTISVGNAPFYSSVVGNKLYISNGHNGVSVIDTTKVTSQLPNLTSFSSTSSDGEYSTGETINITANFGQSLANGSTMTVALNTGASVVLNNVSGTTLSGTYTVGVGETTPDLSISSITSASVTDTSARNRTSYSLPSSQGDLVAENSFITRNLGDTKNIVIGSYQAIEVGEKPYQMTAPITVGGIPYIYVANQADNSVSVIRKTDHTTIATIPVGSEPYGLSTISISGTTYVYVANTGSDSVSVINTNSNSVVATVTVGVKPYYVAVLGTKVYVTNSLSNTVSVIDTATNTVSATIPVGTYPRGIRAYSTYLYVSNYGDPNYSGGNSISVIDSATNTVSATIVLPAGSTGPRGITSLGTNVYVANFRSNNISVINTATNAVTATITVGTGPRGIVGLGSNIYVENFDAGTISVIDTNTNTVTATVNVGHSPSGMSISGTDIYVSRFQDNVVSILNTATNTMRSTFPVISNIRSYAALPTSAEITWTTDIDADSTVEYGLTTDYGATVTSDSLVASHSVALPGLAGGTEYHFRITSIDASGNTTISGDNTFRTGSGGIGIIIGNSKPPIDPIGPDSPTGNSGTTPDPVPPTSVIDYSNPLSRLGSKILLAVENKGELWYDHPRDAYRYLVTPATALELFRTVALGISNDNLSKIPEVTSNQSPGPLAQRLKNLFLLQVENKGQTWYVDHFGYRHFVTRFSIIDMSRNVMTGILNKELEKLPIGKGKQ